MSSGTENSINFNALISLGCALLLIGILGYALLSFITSTPEAEPTAGLIISVILVSLFLLPLMIYFAHESTGKKGDKGDYHVLNYWSIETLKAEKIPEDITGFLSEMLKTRGTGEPKQIMMYKSDKKSEEQQNEQSSPDRYHDWLTDLKDNLGETRVGDFETTILKYTRRKKPEHDPKYVPASNVNSVVLTFGRSTIQLVTAENSVQKKT